MNIRFENMNRSHLLHNFTIVKVSKLLLEIQNVSFLVEWLDNQAKYLGFIIIISD